MSSRLHITLFAAVVTMLGASPASAAGDFLKAGDLSGSWTYYSAQGQAVIKQSGKHISMGLTWTPNSDPAPHYVIETTLTGRSLNGVWRCKATRCLGQRGKFHAQLSADGNEIRVSHTQDPGGVNRWNGVVLSRSSAAGE